MNYDLELITKSLKNSKYFSYLFQNKNVIAIYWTGSRKNDLVDEFSDFDIVVMTQGNEWEEPLYSLKYKNKKMHWYFIGIEYFFKDNTNFLHSTGQMDLIDIKEQHFLYINSKYKEIIELFIKNKKTLSYFAALNMIKNWSNLKIVLKEKEIKQIRRSKYFYHFCYLYDNIHSLPHDKKFLIRVKRMRYNDITKTELEQVYVKIKEVISFLLPKQKTITDEILNLQAKIATLIDAE